MRTAPDQQLLREWLDVIGNGVHQQAGALSVRERRTGVTLPVPSKNVVKNMEEIINFCFPSFLFTDPLRNADKIAENALLCPTNNDVDFINNLAMERMHGTAFTYTSIDQPLEPRIEDEFNTFRSDFNLEVVHNETPSGMPPHNLHLKVTL